ncbi:MAG: hypothetical protein AAGJ18_09545 [Bacteroidota bacterium]
MIHPFLVLTSALCFLACTNSFPPEDSDLAKRTLKGPVKFVEETAYWAKKRAKPFDLNQLNLADDFRDQSTRRWHFNEDGQIRLSRYFKEGQLKWEIRDSFDQRGNRIQRLRYDAYQEKILERTEIFRYNEENKLLEESAFDLDSILVLKAINIYNDTQQLIKTVTNQGEFQKKIHTTTFKYDAAERVVEQREERWRNPSIRVVYTYDGTSSHKASKEVYQSDSILVRKEDYVYQTDNQLAKKTATYLENGYEWVYLYNEEGWIATSQKIELTGRKAIIKDYENLYEYDARGNWTRKAVFDHGVLSQLMLRRIEYY